MRSRPNALFRPVFLWPDVPGALNLRRERSVMNVQSFPGAALHGEERAHEADHPSSLVAKFGVDQPLRLDCGIDLAPFQIAYQTYGQLNADRSNAILIFHALTGDQHAANIH